jgi:hypothetical protein
MWSDRNLMAADVAAIRRNESIRPATEAKNRTREAEKKEQAMARVEQGETVEELTKPGGARSERAVLLHLEDTKRVRFLS